MEIRSVRRAVLVLVMASLAACGGTRDRVVPRPRVDAHATTPVEHASNEQADRGHSNAQGATAEAEASRGAPTDSPRQDESRAASRHRRSGGDLDGLTASAGATASIGPSLGESGATFGLGNVGTVGHGSGTGAAYGIGGGRVMERNVRASPSPVTTAPGEPFREESADANREGYQAIRQNPFVAVADSPLSTFSTDVDTASYANVRRFLRDGALPPASAVRVEELVNYFHYDYPAPRGEDPVALHAEVGPCPWAESHRLVSLGLRARDIERMDAPRNLVFLIDVSGSMEDPDKLPLLKRAFSMLVPQLTARDHVALVVYAGSSGVVLPSTRGDQHERILSALDRLSAGGSTHGAAGIEAAYLEAQRSFVEGGINRVILATDGDFNVGVSSLGELERLIETKRETGVFLTVLGFGTGNLRDDTMETLADRGNGNYAYIDSIDEARRVLVAQANSTLVTVAKDVKVQVEWNPAEIASYRLLGYENRMLAARDFNDDRKDAGELGSGHTVTALYEIVPRGAADAASLGRPNVDPLRYQRGTEPAAVEPAQHGELLTFKVRYKRPDASTSQRIELPVRQGTADGASIDLEFATAMAGFGLYLRRDEVASVPLDAIARLAEHSARGERTELVSLIRRARSLAN